MKFHNCHHTIAISIFQIIQLIFISVHFLRGFEEKEILPTWQISLFILLIIKLQILCSVSGLVKYVAFSDVVFPQFNSTTGSKVQRKW